jgi:5-methylcytosine-specific restriction endonuclease McrA
METKECSKCHAVKPVTEFYRKRKDSDELRPWCKACCNEDSRTNYQKDPQKRIEQTSRWQRENPDKARERDRRYKERHPERRRETYKRYNETHTGERRAYRRTEQFRAAVRRCVEAKPEQYRETARKWEQANPDKVIAKAHRRRTRKEANGGSFTAPEWAALKAKYNHTCLACGRKEPKITLTPDHVIPVIHGGSNDISNIQPLCVSCNSRKHTKTIDYR